MLLWFQMHHLLPLLLNSGSPSQFALPMLAEMLQKLWTLTAGVIIFIFSLPEQVVFSCARSSVWLSD